MNTVVCNYGLMVLEEEGDVSGGNFAVRDPSNTLTEKAWDIVACRFIKSEILLYSQDMLLIRCLVCMAALPSGFCSCPKCFASSVFDVDVAPAVGVTPLVEPDAIVEITARDVNQMARVAAHGSGGFHLRSKSAEYWRSVGAAIKWRMKWTSDWPAPRPGENNSVDFRLEIASKAVGHGSRET